ncbi:hypothetical protein KY284_019924 [Solanum tuberosum]|nr:hypothetical protein KY284_019924 [Solanum tuberosum]
MRTQMYMIKNIIRMRGTLEEQTPRIDKMQPTKVNKKQDEEEEDDLEAFIEQIGREGNLSPRQLA